MRQGNTTALASLTTDGGNGTAVNGGLVKTSGPQSYADAVTVGAAATLFQSTAGGTIDFASTLDGASAVTVTTGGQTTFAGAVGNLTALVAVLVTGAGVDDGVAAPQKHAIILLKTAVKSPDLACGSEDASGRNPRIHAVARVFHPAFLADFLPNGRVESSS